MSINRLHFKACEAVIWNENEDYREIPYASYVDRISGRSRNDRIWTSLVQVALVLAFRWRDQQWLHRPEDVDELALPAGAGLSEDAFKIGAGSLDSNSMPDSAIR
jgi:hypothetical protein